MTDLVFKNFDEILQSGRKYSIVYADPPWPYQFSFTRTAPGAADYPTMPLADIITMPVHKIVNKDAVLFMWIIHSQLQYLDQVIASWGFSYKTCAFTWVKRNRQEDSWFWGMGGWTRQNSELCLLGTRGHVKRLSGNVHSVVDTRIEEHSKKPACVRGRILDLVGDLPRIELFSRRRIQGWDVFGNQIE